ncbi:ATPase/DNA packaging protein [Chlorogloeopsis sp. ULAP02]|uniref:ATPase/DNA packaging protein n=1 Tax=Chlorogloeopsis sp. ULAP02 TaxID=3107926 RepID=UPI0031349801
MKKYSIMTLGPSGSGKTVFLASLFKQLSTQGEYGFFLDVEDSLQRKLLNTYYTEIITGETWPKGTQEIKDWTFTCCVKTKDLSVHLGIYRSYAS